MCVGGGRGGGALAIKLRPGMHSYHTQPLYPSAARRLTRAVHAHTALSPSHTPVLAPPPDSSQHRNHHNDQRLHGRLLRQGRGADGHGHRPRHPRRQGEQGGAVVACQSRVQVWESCTPAARRLERPLACMWARAEGEAAASALAICPFAPPPPPTSFPRPRPIAFPPTHPLQSIIHKTDRVLVPDDFL